MQRLFLQLLIKGVLVGRYIADFLRGLRQPKPVNCNLDELFRDVSRRI